MVSTMFQVAVVALAALASAPSIDAHGTLSKPGLKFTGSAYGGDFSATVPMSAMPAVAPDRYGPSNSWADVFGNAFKAQSQYKTFKDFIMKNQDMSKGRKKNPSSAECGFTDPTSGAVQALPDQLEWYGGQMNHPGPCEVWCDNEVVVPFTANCQAAFPSGKMKYDKAKCVGKSRLTLYWMSTLNEWQVYIDCAKIGGGGGGTASTTTRSSGTTPAPANKNNNKSSNKATPAPANKNNNNKGNNNMGKARGADWDTDSYNFTSLTN